MYSKSLPFKIHIDIHATSMITCTVPTLFDHICTDVAVMMRHIFSYDILIRFMRIILYRDICELNIRSFTRF